MKTLLAKSDGETSRNQKRHLAVYILQDLGV